MSIKKNRKTVIDTITQLAGFECIVGEGTNGHGPTIVFEMFGTRWEFGYDLSPKSEYGAEKTRKAVRHAMLAKAANRNLTNEIIYKGTEWTSLSPNPMAHDLAHVQSKASKQHQSFYKH